ncbi:MAG TPA: acyl carrier protein [Solirubrobacteraceae bacterium]|nr:acyl carrier protein [Solirubrobacteraceae bacterium]
MSEDTEIEARVRAELATRFALPDGELDDGDSLRDDLGADSLAIAEALAALEHRLGVELPDTDEFLAGLQTVGDLVRACRTAAASA